MRREPTGAECAPIPRTPWRLCGREIRCAIDPDALHKDTLVAILSSSLPKDQQQAAGELIVECVNTCAAQTATLDLPSVAGLGLPPVHLPVHGLPLRGSPHPPQEES